MHDGNHGAPRLPEPRFNQRKDVFLINQIEVVRRFVENENLRILGEHLRQKRALQFAAGERQHAGAAQLSQAGQFERALDALLSVVVARG